MGDIGQVSRRPVHYGTALVDLRRPQNRGSRQALRA